MILGYRCLRLAETPGKPILVLCYNVALAAKLAQVIRGKGVADRVAVRNFHGWCFDQLRLYNVPKPEAGEGFFDRMVDTVVRAVARGQIPAAQYGAVLIDEGHDFRPEWLQLVARMVDPETNSLLVLYDDAQAIYTKRARRKFSFRSVGIEARGRTTILRLNYRNTAEVLAVACEFAHEVLTPEAAEEDGVPLVEPSSAGRHGPPPELVRLPSLKAEGRFIAERLKALHAGGRAWSEMAVVYRSQFVGEEATVALRAAGIPVEWLQERKTRRPFDAGHESVKVLTMHSSKGLEFPVVAVPGIGFMPHEKEAPEDEARLLYVAMTRAMDQLLMTCHRASAFAERVESACVRQAILGVPARAVEARGAARRGLLSSVIQKAQSFLQ